MYEIYTTMYEISKIKGNEIPPFALTELILSKYQLLEDYTKT